MLASALLFGLIHLDPAGDAAAFTRIPFAILVGVGLGLLRVRTRLAASRPILAHAVLNTITFATVVVTGVGHGDRDARTRRSARPCSSAGSVLTAIALRHARPPSTRPDDC